MVAVHQACRSLHDGETDMALAGGVMLMLDSRLYASASGQGMLSPTGRCHSFDVEARSRPGAAVRGASAAGLFRIATTCRNHFPWGPKSKLDKGLRFALACAHTFAALGLRRFASLDGWLKYFRHRQCLATVAGGTAGIVVGAASGLAVGGAPDAAVGKQEGLV